MIYTKTDFDGAVAATATFAGHRREAHAIIRTTLAGHPFHEQLRAISLAAAGLENQLGMRPVFKRYFLSDPANQMPLLGGQQPCACSYIRQPPLDGTKIALWMILEQDPDYVPADHGMWINSRGRIWLGDAPADSGSSRQMTVQALASLAEALAAKGGSLADNCLRTWFMVRDVDVNYAGVVDGRNELFSRHGLTPRTHFIASTGIEGAPADNSSVVAFNAIADLSLAPEQITYIKGASHLNPTIEYGVAFERAVAVDYADRRHVYVSGTASIDNRGRILHPGDIIGQTERMLENIGVLLDEAACSFSDVAHLIVYIRDIADAGSVARIFNDRLPMIPTVIVHAPVCRPGWLIETECMAIKEASKPLYDEF